MYIDMSVLDQECTRLACLMANSGMDHLVVPSARTPEEAGAAMEEEFAAQLGKSYARIAAVGSEAECILPTMLMAMAGKLSILATDLALRTDRDADEIIRSIGGR